MRWIGYVIRHDDFLCRLVLFIEIGGLTQGILDFGRVI
jgi:hypothetical protein